MADQDDTDFKELISGVNEKLHSIDVSVARLETSFENHLVSDAKYLEQLSTNLADINDRLLEYGKSLDTHIAGVNELKIMNKLFQERMDNDQKRVAKLETEVAIAKKPFDWIIGSWHFAKWVAAMATAIGLIYQLFIRLGK